LSNPHNHHHWQRRDAPPLVVLRAAEPDRRAVTRPKRVDRRCYAYGLFTDV